MTKSGIIKERGDGMLKKIISFMLFIFLINSLPKLVLAETLLDNKSTSESTQDFDNKEKNINETLNEEIIKEDENFIDKYNDNNIDNLIEISEVKYDTNGLKLMPICGDISAYDLEKEAYAIYDTGFEKCEINWRYEDFDSSEPGIKMLIGDIVLPEGFKFKDDPITLEKPIYIYVEGDESTYITINSSEFDSKANILIPLNLPKEDLDNYLIEYIEDLYLDLNEIDLYTKNSNEFLITSVDIDTSKINTNEIGTYYPFDFNLPGIKLSDEFKISTSVHVIPNDKIYLLGVKPTSVSYLFGWLYPVDNFIVWISKNDGEWEINNENDFVVGLKQDFTIFFDSFEEGNKYKIKLEYENKFSNILELDFVNSKIPNITDLEERPGTDREEQELPDHSEENNEEEYSNPIDPDITIMETGDRLKLSIESNPKYIHLEKEKIYISLPTNFLQKLSIKDEDKLSINIKSNDDTISSSISINNKEIYIELEEPMIIAIPKIDNLKSVRNNKDDSIKFENKNNQTIIKTKTTGTFDLEKENNNKKTIDNKKSNLIIKDKIKDEDNNINNTSFIDEYKPIIISILFGILAVIIYIIFVVKRWTQ